MRRRFVVVFALAPVLLAGCVSEAETRAQAAAAYQQQANRKFADGEVIERLSQRFEDKYPAVVTRIREARGALKKIKVVRFLGPENFGYPKAPAKPLEKLWIAILIDRLGSATLVECLAEGDQPAKLEHQALVRETVSGWRFSPFTIDGQPVDSPNYFPALTDGTQIFLSSARVF